MSLNFTLGPTVLGVLNIKNKLLRIHNHMECKIQQMKWVICNRGEGKWGFVAPGVVVYFGSSET